MGLGFADRNDSFDLNVTIQDHFKYACIFYRYKVVDKVLLTIITHDIKHFLNLSR